MKILRYLCVPISLVVASWIVTFVLLIVNSSHGPNATVRVRCLLPYHPHVLVDYQSEDREPIRGVLEYRGVEIKSARWYAEDGEIISTEEFGSSSTSSTGSSWVDRGDGVYVPSVEPGIEFRSRYSSHGGKFSSHENVNKWSYQGELLFQERRYGYEAPLQIFASCLIAYLVLVLVIDRKRFRHNNIEEWGVGFRTTKSMLMLYGVIFLGFVGYAVCRWGVYFGSQSASISVVGALVWLSASVIAVQLGMKLLRWGSLFHALCTVPAFSFCCYTALVYWSITIG